VSLSASIVLAALIFYAAHDEQYIFLMSPNSWGRHQDLYFESKLLMFTINFAPAMLITISTVTTLDRSSTMKMICLGITTVSSAAAIRILLFHGSQLWGADYDKSVSFFYDGPGFSIVSYGILLVMGSVAALNFRFGWMIAAIFLMCAVLLARRVDSALIVLSVLTYYGWSFFSVKRAPAARSMIGFILLSAILISMSINGHSITYFENIEEGVVQRSSIVFPQENEAVDDHLSRLVDIWSPRGLGYLANGTLGGGHLYPHNLAIEVFYELGVVATIALAFIIFSPLCMGLTNLKSLNPSQVLACALLIVVMGLSLKAGDISNIGRLLFSAAICEALLRSPPIKLTDPRMPMPFRHSGG